MSPKLEDVSAEQPGEQASVPEQTPEAEAAEPAESRETIHLDPRFLVDKLQKTVERNAVSAVQNEAAIEQLVQERDIDRNTIVQLRARIVFLTAQIPKKPVTKKKKPVTKKKTSNKKSAAS